MDSTNWAGLHGLFSDSNRSQSGRDRGEVGGELSEVEAGGVSSLLVEPVVARLPRNTARRMPRSYVFSRPK